MLRKLKNAVHLAQARWANFRSGNPSSKLTVIGVTGTDGKTTTSSLIHHILTTAGVKTGISSTLLSPHTTTPGRGAVHRFLAQCLKNSCTHAIIEVTSIGIDQNRVAAIKFDIGVLTNIAQNEHLDYHGTFEKYRDTKINWLLSYKTIVTNADDSSLSNLKSLLQRSAEPISNRYVKNQKLITYGIKTKADIIPKSLKYTTMLLGEFNTYNILAAITVCRELEIPDETITQAIATFKAPEGRLEVVTTKPFTVIVDFAHTPQAFEKVLPVAKSLLKSKKNKLIHVFGATGDRDQDKRPIMAAIASKYDDYIFLTTEDTYSEEPKNILESLEKGLKDSWYANYKVIPDRREAIRRALNFATKGDVVILTGVGHQKSINAAGREIPWGEAKVVKELLHAK